MIEDGFWFYKKNWRDKLTIVEVKTYFNTEDTIVYEMGFRDPIWLKEALEQGQFYQKIEIPEDLKNER